MPIPGWMSGERRLRMNATTTRISFLDRLERGDVLIADGATGTTCQRMGLPIGVAPEEWVFTDPERIIELHRGFAEAGSDIVLTCTFGGTSMRLADGPAGRARGRAQPPRGRAGARGRRPRHPGRRLARARRASCASRSARSRTTRRPTPMPSRPRRSPRAASTCSCSRRCSARSRPARRSTACAARPISRSC